MLRSFPTRLNVFLLKLLSLVQRVRESQTQNQGLDPGIIKSNLIMPFLQQISNSVLWALEDLKTVCDLESMFDEDIWRLIDFHLV